MRGVSEEPVENTFHIFVAIFVIAIFFLFAQSIFQKSARLSITEFETGGCACKDADPAAKVGCAEGRTVVCKNPCDHPSSPFGGLPKTCYGKQTMDMTTALNYKVNQIEICNIVRFSVGNVINAQSSVKINGKDIKEKITGPRDTENCITHKFSEPAIVKSVEADSGTGSYMDRLLVKWNAPAPLPD